MGSFMVSLIRRDSPYFNTEGGCLINKNQSKTLPLEALIVEYGDSHEFSKLYLFLGVNV